MTSAERRAKKLGLYIVFKARRFADDEQTPVTDVGPSANSPEPEPGHALADRIYAAMVDRLGNGAERYDKKKLADMRLTVEKAVAFGGSHAAAAFDEAARLYRPLPLDGGYNLLGLFYSIASRLRREAMAEESEIDEPPQTARPTISPTDQISQLRPSPD